MAVDYNLVVLGRGSVAHHVARQARQYDARIALFWPPSNALDDSDSAMIPPPFEWGTALSSLRHLNYSRYAYQPGPYNMGTALFQGRGMDQSTPSPCSVNWSCLVRSLPTLARSGNEHSAFNLAKLGIDVIQGHGHFVSVPQSGFAVNDVTADPVNRRLLRANAYLIALDGQAVVPAIAGIESIPYHTLDTFFLPGRFISQPTSVLIISDQIAGIEVANVLANLGTKVTLVMTTPHVLPLADADVNQWLQSSLAASGVRTHVGAVIKRVYSQDNGCVAEFEQENPALNGGVGQSHPATVSPSPATNVIADELLVVMGRQVDFTTLNLGAIAVDYTPQGIPVNARYRSSNPHVFAIGDAIDHPATIAQPNHYQAEAAIALRHALFQGPLLNSLKAGLSLPPLIAPQSLPVMVNTHPPAAWMGWTEAEAYQQYGDRITTLYQSFQSLPQAQRLSAYIPHATAGFCKLVVLDNGQIVGVHIVGIQAEELVNLIAIAMHQSLPMNDLTQLYPPTPSLTADVLRGLVEQWEGDRRNRRPRLAGWLELALNWQRDWGK